MYTLARGAVHGAAFGLAVAAVDVWLEAAHTMQQASAPPAEPLVHAAVHTVVVGAVAGMVCAYLLQERGGGIGRHRLATALVFAVYLAVTASGGPTVALLAGPVIALTLVPLARWIAFKWRWDPVLLGLLAVAAGILLPRLSSH